MLLNERELRIRDTGRVLRKEEAHTKEAYRHDSAVMALKDQARAQNRQGRALQLEHKRRMSSKKEGSQRVVGPAPDHDFF